MKGGKKCREGRGNRKKGIRMKKIIGNNGGEMKRKEKR